MRTARAWSASAREHAYWARRSWQAGARQRVRARGFALSAAATVPDAERAPAA